MNQFWDKFADLDAATCEAVAARLAAGEHPPGVAASLAISPVGIVAAVARVGLGDDASLGPPLVRGRAVRPDLAAVLAHGPTLAELFPRSSRPARLALAAGLLQVLDSWDLSHHAAQEADDLGETATAAAWHMVAHRREPDFANARYWARRIPSSTIYVDLAARAEPLLPRPAAANEAIDRPDWGPQTLIDRAGKARSGSAEATLVRRLQRLEMLVLLDHSAALQI